MLFRSRLLDNDEVVSLEVVEPEGELFVLHQQGWGKRVPLEEYPAKGRYTQGVLTTDIDYLAEIGRIVSARVVHPQDQITVITSNGIVLRTKVEGVSIRGRATRGVRVVNLGDGDSVAALAVLFHADMTRGVDIGGDGRLLEDGNGANSVGTAAGDLEDAEAEETELAGDGEPDESASGDASGDAVLLAEE